MSSTYQRAQEIADRLLQQGVRPTQQLVRNELGTGSVSTIHKALNDWWSGLGARIGQAERLPELPEAVASAMQGVWELAVATAERLTDERRLEMEAQVRRSREAVRQAELAHQRERSDLLGRLEHAVQSVTDLQARCAELQGEGVGLERRTLAAESRSNELLRENRALQAVVERLEGELQRMAGSVLQAECARLETENTNLRKVIERQDLRLSQRK